MHKYKGAIIAHIGPMFGGKTSALLSDVRKMRIAKYKVGLFKPSKDIRYSKEEIVNHDGESLEAIRINSLPEVVKIASEKGFNVIAIDEFQFMTMPHDNYMFVFINYIIQNGITLIVSCLDLDSEMRPFLITKELLPFATHIFKQKAVCVDCGNDATISYCLVDKTEQELVGGEESYAPLCISCYLKRKGFVNESR